MSPILGRGKGAIVPAPASLLKQMTWSGEGPAEFSGDRICDFNAVIIEQLLPATGMDTGYSFVIKVSGLYQLSFQVRQPDFTNGGGFGHGWSGTYGGGGAWIRTKRSGVTLEDNIARQNIGGGAGSGNNQFTCGAINRSLLAGDAVEFWTNTGGASGTGVRNWDAVGQITKLRG
jgi:hypothetical protein